METGRPRILEWYRADTWPRMRRILVAGPAILTTGGVVIGLSFLSHLKHDVRITSVLLGFVLIAGGALLATAGMHRILREETSLAIRTDGVAWRTTAGEVLVAWDSLAAARWDASKGELVLDRTDAAPLRVGERFARVTGARLAERIEQSRRRAAMGFLR